MILNKRKLKKTLGFTLVELLVVMGIIASLATLSLFALRGTRESARDAVRKSDLETIRSGIEMYKADCNNYPIPSSSGDFYTRFGTSLTGSEGTCGNVSAASNTYITEIPKDSVSGRNYYYISDGTTYLLCAGLESDTTSDSTCTTAGANCGSGVTCSYHVVNP